MRMSAEQSRPPTGTAQVPVSMAVMTAEVASFLATTTLRISHYDDPECSKSRTWTGLRPYAAVEPRILLFVTGTARKRGCIWARDEFLELAQGEFRIVLALAMAVRRGIDCVRDSRFDDSQGTVRTAVCRLRKKLEGWLSMPAGTLIVNDGQRGYRLGLSRDNITIDTESLKSAWPDIVNDVEAILA